MNNIKEKFRDSYKQNFDAKNELDQAIQSQATEINTLEQRLAIIKARLKEIDIKLKNASKDLAFKRLSSDEFKGLKTELREKEDELADLVELINNEKEAQQILSNLSQRKSRDIRYLKIDIATELTQHYATEAAKSARESLTNLAYMTLANSNNDRESRDYAYSVIGRVLCEEIFDEDNRNWFLDGKTKADEIITNIFSETEAETPVV